MGIEETIGMGGHFPPQKTKEDMTLEELIEFDLEHGNEASHDSFS